jgi:hypothetical protein
MITIDTIKMILQISGSPQAASSVVESEAQN